MSSLTQARECWSRAAEYPFDKEAVYPEHAHAIGMDALSSRRRCPHDERPAVVLDYGCGGGGDCRSWAIRGCRVTGVDIVSTNVAQAQARFLGAGLAGTFKVLERSAPLPFEDGSFDVAASIGVLHHIPPEPSDQNADAVLSELARVVRPGGTVVVMLYTEMLWQRLQRLVTDMQAVNGYSPERAFGEFTDGAGAWARAYTEKEGREFFSRAGLTVYRVAVYNDGDFRTFSATR